MTERQGHHSNHRERCLPDAVGLNESISHEAEAHTADGAWHYKAVLPNPPPKRDDPEDDCQTETNLMKNRLTEYPSGRRQKCQQDCGRKAVDNAEP